MCVLVCRPEPGQNRMNAMICGRKLRRRRVGKLTKSVLWQGDINTHVLPMPMCVCVCVSRCSSKRDICLASATYAKLVEKKG